MTHGSIAGLRILDLSRVLAGPLCCAILGDHGADVIKVESLAGDETRRYGPPFLDGESSYFMNLNRNKRAIALDLSTDKGRDVIRRLARKCDVLVENFKTGTMERWGLSYEKLRESNARLIFASISSFGRSGPYSGVVGYDGAMQAFAGFMSINGDSASGPLKAGIAIADIATGMLAAQGILLALHHRNSTGAGQKVEVSLLHSVLALLHPHNGNYLNAGVVAKPHGNTHPMISPYDLLPTADRPVYLTSGNDAQFHRLANAIGKPELAADPRFVTNADRVSNRGELVSILSKEFRRRPASEWCRLLWEANIPVGPVNTLAEALADPHVQALGLISEISHPGLTNGVFRSIAPAAKLSCSPGTVCAYPPRLGEHTIEILRETEYSDHEIEDLLRGKVARQMDAGPEDVSWRNARS